MKKELFVSGVTELAGNHTDHQNGRILASAIDLGVTARFEANGSGYVRVQSEGHEPFEVKLSQLEVRTTEFGKAKALTRGVAAAFDELGLHTGGFDATILSTLPVGSGLGSSAAFAVLMAKIFSELFNGGQVPPIVLARSAQQAENRHFGKPSGIMCQMVCALGHTLYADLKTRETEHIHADFCSMGLTLCVTDTGGSHASLGTSYARIPADMIYIANLFDKGLLSDVDPEEFWSRGWDASNRPVRRAMHFFNENERVPLMRDALKNGDGAAYIRLMNESGRSSEELLNNIVTSATGDTKLQQGLEKSAELLAGRGAWRVHGGGFAGCVQALMPKEDFPRYKEEMDRVFGTGSCREIKLV